MFADYHVHTDFSDDSEYKMDDVVKDAIRLGLEEICFTDHVDYGIKRDWDDVMGIEYRKGGEGEPAEMPIANVNYDEYLEYFREMTYVYGDDITLKLGLEFGMQRHTIADYDRLFGKLPLDFVILSVHELEDKELWTRAFQKGKTQDEYIKAYYEEILYLVQHFHDYSVLGHLDLISRYDAQGKYPFEKVKPIIAEILKTSIEDGKGIEVNTSCYRYGVDDLTPSRDILGLYRSLGGEIITIGSDSHKPEHLGAYIKETMEVLKQIGFEHICTFEKMKPSFHRI